MNFPSWSSFARGIDAYVVHLCRIVTHSTLAQWAIAQFYCLDWLTLPLMPFVYKNRNINSNASILFSVAHANMYVHMNVFTRNGELPPLLVMPLIPINIKGAQIFKCNSSRKRFPALRVKALAEVCRPTLNTRALRNLLAMHFVNSELQVST